MADIKEKEVEKIEVKKNSENTTKSNPSSDRSLLYFAKRHWLSIATILYILFPIDFVPDFIPVAGNVDDVILLIFTLFKEYQNFKSGKDLDV